MSLTLPYPTDPSLPANPTPLFSDSTAARGDHLRANNAEIWANLVYIVNNFLGGANLSTDGTFSALSDLLFPSEKAVHTYINSLLPAGVSIEYDGITIPTGWMREDGSNLLRASYPTLFNNISSVIGAVTISIASPGVISSTGHPFQTGDCIHLTTTGALPTGLSANTNYYVIYKDTGSFYLATTFANAVAGTKINTSGTQSGTHTLTWIPWGAADGTHFYLPDTQGLSTEGSGTGSSAPAYNPWLSANYAGRLGQYKQDTIQGFIMSALGGGGQANSTIGFTSTDRVSWQNTLYTQGPYTDGTHGIPRIDYKTAGPRAGKYKIIKVV